MAALAKPINNVVVINAKETKEFIDRFNKNVVKQDFLNSCQKAGNLFTRRSK